MMSSVDNIPGYRDVGRYYCSPPTLRKTAATTYDFPEHPPKKDKKWSLGNLFRRKKKEESDSSSDEECDKKGFLRRRKRDKRKKSNKQRATFDHIVNPTGRGVSTCNGHSVYDDNGILSDPTGGFASYGGRNYTAKVNPNVTINNTTGSITDVARVNLGSADSLNKKHRKSRAKVRAEARREQNKRDTSSDDDSQRSASSSRFRSDENLGKSRDSSLSRKSRAARTERYIRRLSRDEEAAVNRQPYKPEAEQRLLRPASGDVKEGNTSPSASPISRNNSKQTQAIVSGLFTIPPSHNSQTRNKPDVYINNNIANPDPNPISKYSSLASDHKDAKEISYQRSVSYDADIHKSASPEVPAVMHVQFPLSKPNNRLRNMSLVEQPRMYKHPPPPPPRDPWRLVSVTNPDATRPVSYCFERALHHNPEKTLKPHSFNWHPNNRSSSEDHLASESVTLQPRPSSAASDHFVQRFIKRPPTNSADDFRYWAEKNPRSRKPIVIQQQSESQKALNFWKQKDQSEINRIHVKQNPPSPQMFTAQTRVRTKIFLPSVLKADMDPFVEKKRPASPFKPISPDAQNEEKTTIDKNEAPVNNNSRKSSNLEEALDELEAIYNSLRLGDEDLLERAEQREQSIAAKKLQKSKDEPYPGWVGGIPRGAISDSSFSYEPFDSIDSPKKKRILKKSRLVDRKCDDMAYRKLNKERKESGDAKEAMSKISYLLASPVHGGAPDETDAEIFKGQSNEPDVTFDDVVYRSVKYANSNLRVSEPQPPFGIPMGPILPSSNSDYLHAVPENAEQYTAKNKKIPDLVKDDLAFRNLRKDCHKDPVLPPLMPEDFANNNSTGNAPADFNALKKKRAVRSLSANLYNLIQNQSFKLIQVDDEKSKAEPDEKSSLADIADAMEIARQILKDKENKISETRRVFLSDTEAKYRKHDNINERRLNFLNGMKNKEGENESYHQQRIQVNVPKAQENFLQSKPPSGSEKKTTPVRDSGFASAAALEDVLQEGRNITSVESCNKSLEELLDAFAVEADETSKQISRELEATGEGFESANPELLATTKTESMPTEEVGHITPTPEIQESLANVVITRNADSSNPNPITSEIHSESEHDYVNMGSDVETERDSIPMIDESCEENKCKSPFELIAGFQEIAPEKKPTRPRSNDGGAFEDGKTGEGERRGLNPDALTPLKQECAFRSEACVNVSAEGTITSYVTDCDIQCSSNDWFKKGSPARFRRNSLNESRRASGFHVVANNQSASDAEQNDDWKVDNFGLVALQSLESPKLVLKSALKLSCENLAATQTQEVNESQVLKVDHPKFGMSSVRENRNGEEEFEFRKENAGSSSRHTLDATQPTRSWYSDPIVLAFACSYGFACTYQLVSLDAVTVLGLLFVIVSFVAALIL